MNHSASIKQFTDKNMSWQTHESGTSGSMCLASPPISRSSTVFAASVTAHPTTIGPMLVFGGVFPEHWDEPRVCGPKGPHKSRSAGQKPWFRPIPPVVKTAIMKTQREPVDPTDPNRRRLSTMPRVDGLVSLSKQATMMPSFRGMSSEHFAEHAEHRPTFDQRRRFQDAVEGRAHRSVTL